MTKVQILELSTLKLESVTGERFKRARVIAITVSISLKQKCGNNNFQ